MPGFISDGWPIVLSALALGIALGWLIRNAVTAHRIGQLNEDWREQLDRATRQRDRLGDEIGTLRTTVEAQEAVVHQREMAVAKARTDLESALEKEKLMAKNIFTLKAEREGFKSKVAEFQQALMTVKNRSEELQVEFIKSGNFYKAELAKSFEKRKAVEARYENAKLEYESFRNLLQSSRSEHQSANKMLESAKARLANLDSLEQEVIELQAENAGLKHSSSLARQEIDALQRDVLELDELKVQNMELAQVLKSMENSRKQYEDDANRYRKHAGIHEEKSETLRIRLDEVERNFLEMENQQRKALHEARNTASTEANDDSATADIKIDDLQEILGIGKVFEQTLHDLGIVNFQQIASFTVADIARVNSELKEFKGRMEQDDWIGQARELHFKKYGETG